MHVHHVLGIILSPWIHLISFDPQTTSWDQYYHYPLLSSRKLQLREVKQPAQSHPAGQRQTRVSNLGLPGLRPQLYTWTSDSLTEPSLYHSWYHPWTIPALYLDYLPQPQSHPCTIPVDLWPRESREYSTCRVSRDGGLLLYFSNSLLKIIPFLHLFIFPFTESLSFYLFSLIWPQWIPMRREEYI